MESLETPRAQPRRPSWMMPSAADAASAYAARAEPLSRAASGAGAATPLRLSSASSVSASGAAAPWPTPTQHAGGVVYLSGGLAAVPSAPPLSAWAAGAPPVCAFPPVS